MNVPCFQAALERLADFFVHRTCIGFGSPRMYVCRSSTGGVRMRKVCMYACYRAGVGASKDSGYDVALVFFLPPSTSQSSEKFAGLTFGLL